MTTTGNPDDVQIITRGGLDFEVTRYTLEANDHHPEVYVEEWRGPRGGKITIDTTRGKTGHANRQMFVEDYPGDKGRKIAQKNFAAELAGL